mmetsp:Transcript_11404/g.15968  ORF Transcript_11404/g.15968 Transcript_11404/m.15968 type:complete len:388 (-) Transcript_11404:233-1396(-)|eukprot:CAMPEP_0184481332 /NCGR_PEP_ID=MMETSP0113_2-20130426/2897_1 /TAXON_ID=91329 /ORGANISM="Norrisiella sphaerica, Strain BC52" /LENGTH=387 /DNA_ID=CAMNT_0026860421 /DNA_START=95 /DNA_END=1258 /DNA_ORIENTATION=-
MKSGLSLVRRVSLAHLSEFVQHPTQEKLLQSARFLSAQVPTRIGEMLDNLDELPSDIRESYGMQRLLAGFEEAKNEIGSYAVPKQHKESLQHARVLAKMIREMDIDARTACSSMRDDEKRMKSYPNEFNFAVQEIFRLLLPLRVLVAHYHSAANSLNLGGPSDRHESSGSTDTVVKGSTTTPSPAGKDNPAASLGPVADFHSIPDIVEAAIYDSQGFAVEKFGAAPEVKLDVDAYEDSGDLKQPIALCIDTHVHYICMEILKNSYRAMINVHGALEVKEASPIEIHITSSETDVGIAIGDTGGGMSRGSSRNAFKFFQSTAPPLIATYTYSRQFGAAFDGLGFGLPLSRMYAEMMGGTVVLGNRPGYGCTAYVTLSNNGESDCQCFI